MIKPIDAFHESSRESLEIRRKMLVAAQEKTLQMCNINKMLRTKKVSLGAAKNLATN